MAIGAGRLIELLPPHWIASPWWRGWKSGSLLPAAQKRDEVSYVLAAQRTASLLCPPMHGCAPTALSNRGLEKGLAGHRHNANCYIAERLPGGRITFTNHGAT